MSEEHQILTDIHEHILQGNPAGAAAQTQAGLDMGSQPLDLIHNAMIPALKEVGRRFEAGEYFLPEMLISAQAMQAAMDIVRPLLAEGTMKPLGTFVMGTVAGDIHDIGKNLCNTMLESSGFKVIDLGVNVPAETFVKAIKTHQPDAVGMSAFLTTTMHEIDRNISTVGGLVMSRLGRLPRCGDKVRVRNLTLTVASMSGRRPAAHSAVSAQPSLASLRDPP